MFIDRRLAGQFEAFVAAGLQNWHTLGIPAAGDMIALAGDAAACEHDTALEIVSRFGRRHVGNAGVPLEMTPPEVQFYHAWQARWQTASESPRTKSEQAPVGVWLGHACRAAAPQAEWNDTLHKRRFEIVGTVPGRGLQVRLQIWGENRLSRPVHSALTLVSGPHLLADLPAARAFAISHHAIHEGETEARAIAAELCAILELAAATFALP